MKVAVVTPTIGTNTLQKCLHSVSLQTYENISHYVFIDGNQYEKAASSYCDNFNVKKITLEENVGKGWYGHRVYASCSFLVNADIICYLDEDNWFDPTHVEKLVEVIKDGNDWAYSLRKIYDKQGNFLCEDNCESLGKWPVYFKDQLHHIDTSSFAVRRDVAVKVGHAWYGQWGADRQFFHYLAKHFPKYDCSRTHSLCYRLDGNPNSVTREFFDKGNAVHEQKYNGIFPWKEKRLSSPGDQVTLVFI
jgi:glycosyltransferase involved in cell wall biosynthesis